MKALLAISFILTINISFSQIKINIDHQNASHIFELIKKEKQLSVDSLLFLEGTKNLIKQASKFDDNATNKNYVRELKGLLEGTTSDDQKSFRFSQLLNNIEELQLMYDYVTTQESDLNNYLSENLSIYLSPNDTINLNVFLVLGGTSDGFSDGNTFCIDLGFYKDDIEGMKLVMLHEMFHVIQNRLRPNISSLKEKANKADTHILDLLNSLFQEGTASYIANPLTIEDPRGYTSWFQRKFNMNLHRIKDSYQLFQSIFYRLQYDNSISYDDLYGIGFSGIWQSPFYFVGFRMSELIHKYEGDDFLNKYLRLSPTMFLLAYNGYAKIENDPDTYPIFNDHIEKSVKSVEQEMK